MARERRRRRSDEEKEAIVHEFEQSGLSQREFADLWDIQRSLLGRWIREARRGGASEVRALVPVRVTSPAKIGKGVEIRLQPQLSVHVDPGFDEETLRQVVRVLGSC